MEHAATTMLSPLRASEQIQDLALALAAAQGEFPTIAKTKQGKVKGESRQGRAFEYTYAYADIADVLAGILPVLAKHKLAVLQPTIMDRGNIVILTRLVHGSGQWLESEYPVCAIGADHQKMGGALTYSRRYALCTLLGIAADEDTDGEHAAAPNGEGQRSLRSAPQRQPEKVPNPEISPAEEQVNRIKALPTVAAIDKFRSNPAVRKDFDLMSPEDQAWVNATDQSRRQELDGDSDRYA
jgi:hypothetical protein